MIRHFCGYQRGLFLCFSEAVSFSSSGISLKEKQLSTIMAVSEGRNVFFCFPTGFGKSKLCRLLWNWNTNLVEIELSSLCLSGHYIKFLFFSVIRQCQKTTLVLGSAFAETTCSFMHQKLLQLLNGEMSWKENSSLV